MGQKKNHTFGHYPPSVGRRSIRLLTLLSVIVFLQANRYRINSDNDVGQTALVTVNNKKG